VANHREVTAVDLPGVPPDLVPVISKMLQPDRTRRQQQAVEVEATLGALMGPEGQMLARHGLSSILQASFSEEIALELTPAGGIERPADVARPPEPPRPALREARLPPASARQESIVGGVQESTVVNQSSGEMRETVVNQPALGDGETVANAPAPGETVPGAPPPRENDGEGNSQPTFPKSKRSAVGDVTVIGGDPDAARASGARGFLAAVLGPDRPAWHLYAIGAGALGAVLLGYIFVSVITIPPAVPPTPVPTAVVLAPTQAPTATAPKVIEISPIPSPTPAVSATAVAMATAAPPATPVPTARVVTTSRPAPTPRPAPAQFGSLSVNARPWAQVWVDGKQISRDAPVKAYRLTAGTHEVVFVNPPAKFRLEKKVVVPANADVSFFVDVKAGTAQLRH
ncbi:MAG TPA: hypothetical protein VMV18_13390, partial [bacterium]|nr:hypothetical protein [bacterium]